MKNVEITDDRIILTSKAGTLTLYANDTTVGIYIENSKGQMNLVSQPNMPPYICFYNTKDGKVSGYPSALTADEGNGISIQVGNKDPRKVKNISLSDFLEK